MSTAKPLSYAARCERYARQCGWQYDPPEMNIGHLTPPQRRRALRKERRSWRGYACGTSRDDARWNFYCDVCGLPDPYDGTGDGIGSCDCPRCQCGSAAHSVLCSCPPDESWGGDYGYDGHSPGDEYSIYPDDSRTTYGDSFAY